MNRREALRRAAAISGFAVTASAGIGFLEGCRPSGDPEWIQVFLSKDDVNLVSAIAEIILPETETPGAIELHVPEFIDLMLRDGYPQPDQENFLRGLKNFREKVIADHNSTFEKCSGDLKTEIISEEEKISYGDLWQTGRKSFYLIIKELTLLGYFSSEYVMTNLLDYHPVATRYEGCVPFSKGGRIYVDNNV